MADVNFEVFQAQSQDRYGLDLNGGMQALTGIRQDMNGICRTLFGKEAAHCYTELAALWGNTNQLQTTSSFENGTGTWLTGSANVVATDSTEWAAVGSHSLKLTRAVSVGGVAVYTGAAAAAKFPAGVGETIYSRVVVYNASSSSQSFALRHRHYTGTTLISEPASVAVPVAAGATAVLSHSEVTPATTDGMQFGIITTTVTFAVGEAAFVDALSTGRSAPTGWSPSAGD